MSRPALDESAKVQDLPRPDTLAADSTEGNLKEMSNEAFLRLNSGGGRTGGVLACGSAATVNHHYDHDNLS